MRNNCPCFASPPSGVSKITFNSWMRAFPVITGFPPSFFTFRSKALMSRTGNLISVSFPIASLRVSFFYRTRFCGWPTSASITNALQLYSVPSRQLHRNQKMEPKSTSESIFAPDATSESAHPRPPVADRRPVEHHLHGDLRIDNYAWLREKDNPEVIQHLEAENAYTKFVLHPTEAFQEKLYQEMLSRIQQTDLTVPYQLRGYFYFTKTLEGKQYPLHYRRPGSANGAEELLLDLNALAEGHSFLGLGAFEVSDDNQLLAYSTDITGFRQYTLQIKDLRTGELLPFRSERVTSVAWATDNRALFYTVEDAVTKRSLRLYRHTLGDPGPDPLLFEEADERFRI